MCKLKHEVFKNTNSYELFIKTKNNHLRNRLYRQLIFLFSNITYDNINDMIHDFFFLLNLGLEHRSYDNVNIILSFITSFRCRLENTSIIKNYLSQFQLDILRFDNDTNIEQKVILNKVMSQLYNYFSY